MLSKIWFVFENRGLNKPFVSVWIMSIGSFHVGGVKQKFGLISVQHYMTDRQ